MLSYKENLSCLASVKMASWTLGSGGIMIFTPTWEQFRDFQGFISYMEEQGAHHCGVAKVGAWSCAN